MEFTPEQKDDLYRLFQSWVEFKTGVKYLKPSSTTEAYVGDVRDLPYFKDSNLGLFLHSSYPVDYADAPKSAPIEQNGVTRFEPLASSQMQLATPKAKAALEELGLTCSTERQMVHLEPRMANLVRMLEEEDGPDVGERAKKLFARVKEVGNIPIDFIHFDTKQPAIEQALDSLWQDRGFIDFLRKKELSTELLIHHPVTNRPLDVREAAKSAAESIEESHGYIRAMYQHANALGAHDLLTEMVGQARIAKYKLERGPADNGEKAIVMHGRGYSYADSQALHIVNDWLHFKTGAKFNRLPNDRKLRIESGDPESPFFGKLTFNIVTTYPKMPKEVTPTTVGADGITRIGGHLVLTPEAQEAISKANDALSALGLTFDQQRTLVDPSEGNVFMGVSKNFDDKTISDVHPDQAVPCHIFTVTPTVETMSKAVDMIVNDPEFLAWHKTAKGRADLSTHPYTGLSTKPQAEANLLMRRINEAEAHIADAYQKADDGGYRHLLDSMMVSKTGRSLGIADDTSDE